MKAGYTAKVVGSVVATLSLAVAGISLSGPASADGVAFTTVDNTYVVPITSTAIGLTTSFCTTSFPRLTGTLAWVTDDTTGVYIAAVETRPHEGSGGIDGSDFLIQGVSVNSDNVILHTRIICAEESS